MLLPNCRSHEHASLCMEQHRSAVVLGLVQNQLISSTWKGRSLPSRPRRQDRQGEPRISASREHCIVPQAGLTCEYGGLGIDQAAQSVFRVSLRGVLDPVNH